MRYVKAATVLLVCLVVGLFLGERFPARADTFALAGIAIGLAASARIVLRRRRRKARAKPTPM